MTGFYCRLAVVLIATLAGSCPAQTASDDVLNMVIDLLQSSDRDTRGLALQQIREDLPGEEATRKFADLLPTLASENQAALIQALMDRGDPVARFAIRRALESPAEPIRLSAVRALGRLGDADDVPALARIGGNSAGSERALARASLARLSGQAVNRRIIDLMDEVPTRERAVLLLTLSARQVSGASSAILAQASHPDDDVRRAALEACGALCNPGDVPALLGLLSSAALDQDRNAVEAALLAVSRRGRGECLQPVLYAWAGASLQVRECLLRALAAIGGEEAFRAIVEASQDAESSTRDEAIRLLAEWPNETATKPLLSIVLHPVRPAHRLVAFRGLVRLAGGDDIRPPDMPLLAQAWSLAATVEEKELVLGALTGLSRVTIEAVRVAGGALEMPEVREQGALAVTILGEKLKPKERSPLRHLFDRASEVATDAGTRARLRAMTVLDQ